MNQKTAAVVVAVVAIVIATAVITETPQFIGDKLGEDAGLTPNCNDGPYNANCVCDTGERRISVPWFGYPKWHCEVIEDLLIDPESPTFTDDAIAFAREYLTRNCGSVCTHLQCESLEPCYEDVGVFSKTVPTPTKPDCIEASFGYGANGERKVNVECKEVTEFENLGTCTGTTDTSCTNGFGVCEDGVCWTRRVSVIPWDMEFFVESVTGIPNTLEIHKFNNYCVDPGMTMRCTEPSACDRIKEVSGNPNACTGTLVMNVLPNDFML